MRRLMMERNPLTLTSRGKLVDLHKPLRRLRGVDACPGLAVHMEPDLFLLVSVGTGPP